jgi:hypothetical protein
MAAPKRAQSRIEVGSDEAKRVVCKALFKIAELWQLPDAKFAELLHVDKSTVSKWRKQQMVPDTGIQAEVNKTVLALHRSLGSIFRSATDQVAWLKTPHPTIGRAPMEVATQSLEGLFKIRRYADYVRGRGA